MVELVMGHLRGCYQRRPRRCLVCFSVSLAAASIGTVWLCGGGAGLVGVAVAMIVGPS